ncbi:unnamed protein product [Thlaspi arvense]|uniref:VAMP-like protein n=1 Tax=Thlaspi arvense TaxID=13288 RepID=A0AAU9SSZ5_THLAR|nr:unnamed protein product [Thlaspi arvense]
MVHYCCVSRDSKILYAYNGGDHSNETLAALCLEKTPPFHNWYFESIEHLRDEFKKAARNNCKGRSFTAMIGSVNVEDQLVPVVSKLIASLERVAEANNNDLMSKSSDLVEQQSEAVNSSTNAPLLGRPSKQEKKKRKDHVISLRGIELEEHRKSNVKGNRTERTDASTSLQKEYVPSRGRSDSQRFEWKWRRLVQIVLAIDAAICLTLFGIWLAICEGIKCTPLLFVCEESEDYEAQIRPGLEDLT